MAPVREWFSKFLFPADSGRWLAILRIGLGFQIISYALSLRQDWSFLFSVRGNALLMRELMEAALSAETRFSPRLGWFVTAGAHLGLSEYRVLSLTWSCLLVAGVGLAIGLFCRPAAIVTWFLYVCSVRSGQLLSYGVDNFTTIGLFYLTIAPLPDRYSLEWRLRKGRTMDPIRFGFHRRILQLHLCLIYWFGGVTKAMGRDWWDGTSIWRALTLPPFIQISPELMIRFAPFLPLCGILVCLLETGYPIFIWPRRTRAWWLGGILGMHLLVGLTMGLYLFASIMLVLNLAAFGAEFVPGRQKLLVFWTRGRDIEPVAAEGRTRQDSRHE